MSAEMLDLLPWTRQQFPALKQTVRGHACVFFDGPAGTQVPQCVIDAMTSYLSRCNANRGGRFGTSRRSDEWSASHMRRRAPCQ